MKSFNPEIHVKRRFQYHTQENKDLLSCLKVKSSDNGVLDGSMCINRSLKSKKLAQLMTLFKILKQNTETDNDSVADYNAGSESHPAAWRPDNPSWNFER